MTGRISLHYEDEDCDELVEMSFDSNCRAQDKRSADVTTTNGGGMKVELHLGDCLEVMRGMADKSVDAVITDPPYGNNLNYASYVDTRESLEKLVPAFMKECLRIAERVVVTPGVANIYLYPKYTWILSWVNMAGIGSTSWGFSCWQPILVYGKDPFLQTGKGRRPDTFQQRNNEVAKVNHPCPKPNNVMRWIIERTTFDKTTILDPFMGSGTTGVACVQTGRKFIGIEIDEGYFDIACKRISDALKQPLLPFTEGKDDRQN